MAIATPSEATSASVEPVIAATVQEQQASREVDLILSSVDRQDIGLWVRGERVSLPAPVLGALIQVLRQVARGRAVSLVPRAAQLTPQQAAELLGVSRPFLMRLVSDGQLQSIKVGSHHRLDLREVLEFRRRRDARFDAAMDQLAADAQSAGGYE